MIFNKLILLFALLCLSVPAKSQMPVFRQHDVRESGGAVFGQVHQGGDAWLWLGSNEGVFRYDGQGFQRFALPDTLSGTQVSRVFSAFDTLWIGLANGSICFLPNIGSFSKSSSGKVRRWEPEEGTPKQKITGFAFDNSGGFWFSTYGEGIYCRKNRRVFQFNAEDDGLSGDEIYEIACDAKGRIWAATDNGVSICSITANGEKSVQTLGKEAGLPDEIVTALLADSKGDIWLGTDEHGFCHYDVENQRFTTKFDTWGYGSVLSISLIEGIELWMVTEAVGLLKFNLQTSKFSELPKGHFLQKSKIRATWKDREGLIWLTTDKGGLISANVKFSWLETPFADPQALLIDREKRLWVGSQEGLFRNENGVFRQILPQKQNVISLCETPDGNILVGTFGNGLFVVDASGKVIRNLSEGAELPNGSILSIAATKSEIWLATLGGVVKIETNGAQPAHFQQFTHQSALGTSYVYKVLADRRGRVWFGTDGKGLTLFENGQFRHFTEAAGHSLKTVFCIAEGKDGKVWFSNGPNGLFCYDGEKFEHFDRKNGLHSQNITGLEVDQNGQLIIAYEEGLDILTPETSHIAFFDMTSGAPNIENNLNAICKDPQTGNIWMGGKGGLLRVVAFREKIEFDPETRIRSVSLFLKPIDFQADTRFDHDENYFIFDFTGLWFSNPEAVRYRFKLDGFDPGWKTSKDHFAHYPNLPPGKYVFRVESSEHGEFENTREATFAFEIRHPFWTRWWFVLLSIGAVVWLFRWFINWRDERLQRENRLKQEKIESQFAALKSQINPHFLFNSFNTLITIIEENPKVAVEYVEHLSDFYRTIMVYREKNLISLTEEMDLVKNFCFLLKKRYEQNFDLKISVNGVSGEIMPLTLQMLVENAVKHNIISKSKPLTIEIFIENQTYIVVRNNIQLKIKPEPSTNFGLQSLVNRYQMLGERQVLVSDEGGFFTVKVPII